APTTQATSAVFGTETSSTLDLTSFSAPSGGADGYAIYISDTNTFTAPSDGDEPTADLSWNGSGQQAVYFDTSASPNITVSDLDPGTQYFFQIYAYNDCSGTETYETTGLNATDTTAPDITPPTFENGTPSSSAIQPTKFTFNVDIDEAGTIYYVVVDDGDPAPSASEVKAGTGSGGSGQLKSGNATVTSSPFLKTFLLTSLTSNKAYDVYVVAEDDESPPNLQTSPTKLDFTTAACPAPTTQATSAVFGTETSST
ncbi:MAG: hypothetical protein GY893_11690, partial [bacterium]|nr:hypothetical protein [bacterium]